VTKIYSISCDDTFGIDDIGVISAVELKIIQYMIQIDCPTNWSVENIIRIANEVKNIELYNFN
jgi:hypothetical protein